jgi:hypothetical protein
MYNNVRKYPPKSNKIEHYVLSWKRGTYHRVRVKSSLRRNRSILQLKHVRAYLELEAPRVDVTLGLTRMNKLLSNSTVWV